MKKRFWIRLIPFLLFNILIAGCTSSQSAKVAPQPPPSVKIASVVFPGGPPQGIIMTTKGFLQEKLKGQEIETIYTRNIDKVAKEMKEEKYDFIFCYYGTIAEYASNMSEWDNGNNFVIIANISNGPGNRLLAQSSIKDIKELDGKTIGVFNRDYAGLTLVANTLKENGLDIIERGGTVQIRLGDSVAMLNDFKSGKLDGFMARPSFREPGFTTLKEPNQMAYSGLPPYQVLLVRKNFLKDYPEITEKVLEAHAEGTEWITKNRQETADLVWAESEKFYKAENMIQLMPQREAMAATYNKMLVNVYPNLQFLEDIWSYMEKYNTKKPYPLKEVVDFTLLDKVLKAKGLPSVEEYNKANYNIK